MLKMKKKMEIKFSRNLPNLDAALGQSARHGLSIGGLLRWPLCGHLLIVLMETLQLDIDEWPRIH